MREAARALIEEHYSPRPVIDKMVAVYHELIASSQAASDTTSLCI